MNRKQLFGVSLALGLLVGGLMGGSVARAAASASIVDQPRPIMEWGYNPAIIQVPAGEWVTWSNDGQDDHTVTASDGSFDSGTLMASEGFSWFFDVPGTFDYICTLHPWMKGRVVVGGGALPAPAMVEPMPGMTHETPGMTEEAPMEPPTPSEGLAGAES